MADEQNTPLVDDTTQITQSTAGNVDMDSITKLAETKATAKSEAIVKSMLAQQGLDNDAIKDMVAEWKSKQQTPEQVAKLKDDEINQWKTKATDIENQLIALKKGIPLGDETQVEKVNACLTLAKSYASDDVTFEDALEKAMSVISFTTDKEEQKTGFQPTNGQTNQNNSTGMTEKILHEAKKAMGIRV